MATLGFHTQALSKWDLSSSTDVWVKGKNCHDYIVERLYMSCPMG